MSGVGESLPLKTCTNVNCPCKNPQPVGNFGKNTRSKDGLRHRCKTCRALEYQDDAEGIKARSKQWRENNLERSRAYDRKYREDNGERLRANDREYYQRNKPKWDIAAQLRKERYPDYERRRSERRRRENADYHREANRLYYQRHHPKIVAKRSVWRAGNRQLIRAYNVKWKSKNPEAYRLLRRIESHRRRAMKLGAEGSHSLADVLSKLELQGGLCYYCGRKLEKYHVDHKIPLSKGGSEWPANLCCACPMCNLSKNDKDFWQFLASLV